MSNNPFMNAPQPVQTPFGNATPMPGQNASQGTGEYEIDLSGVTSNSGYIIPDGTYKVRCIDIEQTVSKGGNPMFVWTFEVTEGEHSGFQSKLFTAITPAAMWKVAETVMALGVGQEGEVVKFKRADVLNKECGAIFEQSEYNGTARSSIVKLINKSEL